MDEERKAAEQAYNVVQMLKLTSGATITGTTLETLRIARLAAMKASAGPSLSSEGALNDARAEVVLALGALMESPLTGDKINKGLRALEDWKNELP